MARLAPVVHSATRIQPNDEDSCAAFQVIGVTVHQFRSLTLSGLAGGGKNFPHFAYSL